jgi:pimeloyl-ACP methyl ester carboxylesterase
VRGREENEMAQKLDTLKVPGAVLYHEVRGTGPVLLAIPGGPTDAGVFTEMAGLLQDRYTVVTYDPRGHSRSALDGPPEDIPVQLHADDAAALLDALSSEPAYVLGSSGGGTIGLDLAARHGDKVKALVAHEPPVMELLPDAERWHALFQEIYDTYRTDGVFPAMGKFGAAVEEGGPSYSDAQEPTEPNPATEEMMSRMMANFELFMAHEIRQIGWYVPDFAALKASPSRIAVAGGKTSGEQGAFRAAAALAERLGLELTYFEGAHGGWGAPEEAFAERLDQVLRGDG